MRLGTERQSGGLTVLGKVTTEDADTMRKLKPLYQKAIGITCIYTSVSTIGQITIVKLANNQADQGTLKVRNERRLKGNDETRCTFLTRFLFF